MYFSKFPQETIQQYFVKCLLDIDWNFKWRLWSTRLRDVFSVRLTMHQHALRQYLTLRNRKLLKMWDKISIVCRCLPLFPVNYSYYLLGEERGYCKCGKCICKPGYHGENCGKVNCTIGERKCYNSKGVSQFWIIGCCRLNLIILTIAPTTMNSGKPFAFYSSSKKTILIWHQTLPLDNIISKLTGSAGHFNRPQRLYS